MLNRRRGETSDYLVLHTSGCRTISTHSDVAHPNVFTGRAYLKVCAEDTTALREYIRTESRRADGTFSLICSICRPMVEFRNADESIDDDLDEFERIREAAADSPGLLAAIRELLKTDQTGLTPQEIRRLVRTKYPALYGTESHRRNVARGHYADLDHALLAQIYSSCRNARDIEIDRTTKPLRYRLSPSGGKASASADFAESSVLQSWPKSTPFAEEVSGTSPGGENRGRSDAVEVKCASKRASGSSDFDLERARNNVVRICFQLWRSTQEGEPPRNISATIHHLRTCEIIPYVTASLMLTVCAIRNAFIYSDWRPSHSESESARQAAIAIDEWWQKNPLYLGNSR
ncbi:MAG: hypothetical protein AB7F89_20980 [Pirellulaceae bacterium]